MQAKFPEARSVYSRYALARYIEVASSKNLY